MAQRAADRKPAHLMEDKQALGAALARARKAAGFSLETAATALRDLGHEIGRAAIGHWETGTNVPDALWLQRLSKLYKVTLDELAGGRAGQVLAWPFSQEMHSEVMRMPQEDRPLLEKSMWAFLRKEVPERLTYSESVSTDIAQPSTVNRIGGSENKVGKKAA